MAACPERRRAGALRIRVRGGRARTPGNAADTPGSPASDFLHAVHHLGDEAGLIQHELLDRLPQQKLCVVARLIARDDRQLQIVQDSADVLVLQFHRALAALPQLPMKLCIEFRLRVALLRGLQPQHLDVGGDCGLNFVRGQSLPIRTTSKPRRCRLGTTVASAGELRGLKWPLLGGIGSRRRRPRWSSSRTVAPPAITHQEISDFPQPYRDRNAVRPSRTNSSRAAWTAAEL